jgi:hypothetical protein
LDPDEIEVPEEGAETSFNLPPIGEPDPEPKAAESSPLEARLAALEAERQQDRERYESLLAKSQSTIDRLLQGLPMQQQAPSSSPAGFDALPDLPDPVEKPDEFRKAVADLVRRQATEVSQTLAQHNTSQQQVADIRARFWEENRDLKDYPEFVESAYAKEVQRLQALGIDPSTALLRDPDGLSARVAQLARERVQALGIGKPAEAPGKKGAGRTAGVSGGTTPAVSKAPAVNGDASIGFVDELKRQQVASGYF